MAASQGPRVTQLDAALHQLRAAADIALSARLHAEAAELARPAELLHDKATLERQVEQSGQMDLDYHQRFLQTELHRGIDPSGPSLGG